MWAKGQNLLWFRIFSLLLSMIHFFSTLVETGSRTSRRWRPADGPELRFHGWSGHWKVQKHECGSFFALVWGQDACTQCIKELSATSLWTRRWTLHGHTDGRHWSHSTAIYTPPSLANSLQNGMDSFVPVYSFNSHLFVCWASLYLYQ